MVDDKEKIADGFCKAFTTCAEKLCSLLPPCFTWQNDGEIEKAQTRFLFTHVTKQKVLLHLQGQIIGGELSWIANYLTGRYQYVQHDGVKSDRELVKYGVPQGSILGPLLFLLPINDLVKRVKNCNIQMYADDTVIYTSHSNIGVIEQTITSEMNNVSKWLNKNRFIINLNKGKTESLLFGTAKRLCSKDPMEVYINEKLIKVADGCKYLGVWLEPTLNMNEHLRRVLRKANARVKLLSRVRD